MRHVIIYLVLYECDAPSTTDAIAMMKRDTGVVYDVVQHSIINVPYGCDAITCHWSHGLFSEVGQ